MEQVLLTRLILMRSSVTRGLILKFYENFIISNFFWKILKFYEIFTIFWNFGKFWDFDLFCILPRVPDYCASLRRWIPPVTLYWFPVASFPVQEILSISAMDLESKYCYFYHSWDNKWLNIVYHIFISNNVNSYVNTGSATAISAIGAKLCMI